MPFGRQALGQIQIQYSRDRSLPLPPNTQSLFSRMQTGAYCRLHSCCSLPLLVIVLSLPTFVVHAATAATNRLQQPSTPTPSPAGHRFNSVGKTGVYMGTIDGLDNLTRALTSCSHDKELVLIATTDAFIDAAAQTVGMLSRYGIGHIIITSTSEQACANISRRIPGTCCVWSFPSFPPGDGSSVAGHAFYSHRLLMTIRISLAARALRLGYNLLFLDTDIIIFDDPYKYLKTPPFSRANLLLKGGSYDVNIGVLYAQNVAPDGPVTWAFAEVLDRMLRWAEAPEIITEHQHPKITNLGHVMWDQMVFADAVFSALLGRPIFQASWTYQNGTKNLTWIDEHHKLIAKAVKTRRCRASLTLQQACRSDSFDLSYGALKRPLTGGRWPAALGGRGFPPARGNFSLQWQHTLRESGAPMWPDPDDPACHGLQQAPRSAAEAERSHHQPGGSSARQPHAGRRLSLNRSTRALTAAGTCPGRGKAELLLYFPQFLVSSWTSMLRDHNADQDWSFKVQPPTQVIGHLVFLPIDKRIYKTALKMSLGYYDWSLAQPHRAYFASTPDVPVPRVMAASERLLQRLGGLALEPLLAALAALVTAAAAAGRALAWPTVPCAALHRLIDDMVKSADRRTNDRVDRNQKPGRRIGAIPFALAGAPDTCLWTEYLAGPCLEDGLGLLAPEFVHLLSTLPAAVTLQSAANTLQLPHDAEGMPGNQSQSSVVTCIGPDALGGSRSRRPLDPSACALFRSMSLATFQEASRVLDAQPVMWLDVVPLLLDVDSSESLVKKLAAPRRHCWILA